MLCTSSGTSLICTIFDMLQAYKHVPHMHKITFAHYSQYPPGTRPPSPVSNLLTSSPVPFMRRFLLASILCLTLTAAFLAACSWDYPVWPKDPRSDTPLFRFVINIGNTARAGYINTDGRVVIPPTFQAFGNFNTDDFFNGIALVRIDHHDWYIDTHGKKLFPARDAGPFSEGLAALRRNGKYGHWNTRGVVVIPPRFQSADRFSEGLALVQIGSKYGYIDRKGSFVIPPRFALAFPFRNGIARVIKQSGCLYIGYAPCDFTVLPLPSSPHALPNQDIARCRYSFVDGSGRTLFPATYQDANDFSEGLAPVGDGRRWGFINAKGAMVIPPRYQNAQPFSEGLAPVSINDKWGYVDHAGRLVIAPAFPLATPFSEGVAVTEIPGGQYEFIDKTGSRAIPGLFEGASSFVMGLAHVRYGTEDPTWAYIDHHGHPVFRYNQHRILAP